MASNESYRERPKKAELRRSVRRGTAADDVILLLCCVQRA